MSGAQKVCNACGGEIRMTAYETGPYILYGGWCPNCQRVTLSIPQEAYYDDGYDVESESVIVAKKVRDAVFKSCGIVDSPEFQFKWTTKPNEAKYCSSCEHGYRVVENGKDKGYGCRINDLKPRFNAQLKFDCKDYAPRDEWYGMGWECRNCYWAYRGNDGVQCHAHSEKNIDSMSKHTRGHCKLYRYSPIWAFERAGYTICPECGHEAQITLRGKALCGTCERAWWIE